MNLHSLSLDRNYPYTHLLCQPYPSLEREIKFRLCLFRFFITRGKRYFHSCKYGKEIVQKKCMWCSCEVVVFGYSTYSFQTFSLPSRRLTLGSLLTKWIRRPWYRPFNEEKPFSVRILFSTLIWKGDWQN